MVSTVASQREVQVRPPPGAFLCGVCMVSPCLRGFSPGSLRVLSGFSPGSLRVLRLPPSVQKHDGWMETLTAFEFVLPESEPVLNAAYRETSGPAAAV